MKKLALFALTLALLCEALPAGAQDTMSVYHWGAYIEAQVLELFTTEPGLAVII